MQNHGDGWVFKSFGSDLNVFLARWFTPKNHPFVEVERKS